MKKFASCFFSIFIVLLHAVSFLQAQDITRPAIAGDFPDPSIIKSGNKYYAVGTSSEWAPHFPIYSSSDLYHWSMQGYVFDKAPEWTSGSFWAPEYFFYNNTYYIYYTARRKADNVSCIGVATSKNPDRGFKDRGVIVAFGKEAIDGFVFKEGDDLFISFKAYGLDNRPIELLGSKLSADGLQMEGEVFSMLKDDDRAGMEGQSIIKKDGTYYLFYSAGGCCGNRCSYNVKVAKASNYRGPYEKFAGAPLLQENDFWKCPGHGTFVNTGGDEYYYLYHAYNKRSNVFTGRQGMLAKLLWKAGSWPTLAYSNLQAEPIPAIVDEFTNGKPANYWQYDFRHATPVVKQSKGSLYLSGQADAANPSGIALTVRPFQEAFEMETTIANTNAALKGLCYYGDATAAVGIGVENNKVEFWMVKNGKRSVVDATELSAAAPVNVKLVTDASHLCRTFYKTADSDWKELGSASHTSIAFLPPWDRSPRAGLHFMGDGSLNAQFERFVIKYGN